MSLVSLSLMTCDPPPISFLPSSFSWILSRVSISSQYRSRGNSLILDEDCSSKCLQRLRCHLHHLHHQLHHLRWFFLLLLWMLQRQIQLLWFREGLFLTSIIFTTYFFIMEGQMSEGLNIPFQRHHFLLKCSFISSMGNFITLGMKQLSNRMDWQPFQPWFSWREKLQANIQAPHLSLIPILLNNNMIWHPTHSSSISFILSTQSSIKELSQKSRNWASGNSFLPSDITLLTKDLWLNPLV